MMSKKKIFFILPEVNIGGVEMNTLNFANYLVNHNFEVSIIYQRLTNFEFRKKFNSNIKFIKLSNVSLKRQIFEYLKLIRISSPDVIINSMLFVHIVLIVAKYLSKSKTKILFKIETNLNKSIDARNIFTEKLIYFFFGKIFIRLSDSVVCSSEEILKHSKSYFSNNDSGKLFLNYNPITQSSNKPNFSVKPKHPFFNDGNNVLISIGRLIPEKGFRDLINIFNMLIKKNSSNNQKLLIIGEGKEYYDLREHIDSLSLSNSVDILKFNDDFERYLYFSNIFICNSTYEGFNNNIVHALNMGIYVISKDCDFGPREILLNKEYGALAKNDSELLECLIYFSDQNKSFNEVGFRRSLDFSIERSSENLIKIINR